MPQVSSKLRKKEKRKKKEKKKTRKTQCSSSSSASSRSPSPLPFPRKCHENDRNNSTNSISTSSRGENSSITKKPSKISSFKERFVSSSQRGKTHRRHLSADNVSENCCTILESKEGVETTVQAFPTAARVAAAAVQAPVRNAGWPATCSAARATAATETAKGLGNSISPAAAAVARIDLKHSQNEGSRERNELGCRRSGWDVKPTAEEEALEAEKRRKKRRKTRQRRDNLSDSSVEKNLDAGYTAREEDVRGRFFLSRDTGASCRSDLQDSINTSSKNAKYTVRSNSQSATPAVDASALCDYEVKTYEKAFGLAVGKYSFIGENDFSSAAPAPAATTEATAAAAAAIPKLKLPRFHAGNIRSNKMGDKVNSKTHPHLFWQCWSCSASNYKTRHQCYRCNKLYQK